MNNNLYLLQLFQFTTFTQESMLEFVQLAVFVPFTEQCREGVNLLILTIKTEQCNINTLYLSSSCQPVVVDGNLFLPSA